MKANKVKDSHRPPTDRGMAREKFIRISTTLYKIVGQPRQNRGDATANQNKVRDS